MSEKTNGKKSSVKLWSRDFVIIIVINFLVFMNHLMILSTFPFYIEHLGGTEAFSGMATAVFAIVAVVLRPFIGWVLDNGKRKSVLIIGLCGMALTPIGYLVFATLYLAFICRVLQGAALAFSNTTTATIASDIIPKPRFAEGMGMFGLATALATACAPALGLALMKRVSFAALFLTAFACAAISLILLLIMKVPKIETKKKPLNVKGLIDKDALPASFTALAFLLTYGAVENYVAKYAAEEKLPGGGIFFVIMAIIIFLTRMTAGRVVDRHGEGIFAYSCNISMFAAVLLLGLIPNTATFILAAILSGFGFGGLEPALQSMAVAIATPETRGTANSTFLCAYDIGIGVGGGIAGVLITAIGYHHMFAVVSLFNVLSVLIYTFIGRNHPSSFAYRLKHQNMENQ